MDDFFQFFGFRININFILNITLLLLLLLLLLLYLLIINTKPFWFDMCVIVIPTIYSRCPPNVTADFDVIFNGKDSSRVKGCASLEFRSRHDSNEMKVFSVKFGRFNNGVCVSGTLIDLLFYHRTIYCTFPATPSKLFQYNMHLFWV